MDKYSFTFKKKVVNEYLSNQVGYEFLSRKYNVKPPPGIKEWVKAHYERSQKELNGEVVQRKKKSLVC